MKKPKHIVIVIMMTGSLIFLGMVIHRSQVYLDHQREIRFVNRIPVYLPKGKLLKALCMGHQALAADYFWIQSVLYFGRRAIEHDNIYYIYELYEGDMEKIEHIRELQQHHHLTDPIETDDLNILDDMHEKHIQFEEALNAWQKEKPAPPDSIPLLDRKAPARIFEFPCFGLMDYLFPLIDRATELDPYFKTPYIFSSVTVLSKTGEIDWALELLKRGYAHNPEDWEFPFYLGYVCWLYKGDIQTMTGYFKEAVQKPGCPSYVGELLVGFARHMNQQEMARLYFLSMINSTDNPEIKKRIQKLLRRLGTKNESKELLYESL
ncbi:hypothetical protein JW835_07400 [bacterium]|nr:hypothetical protein [bacterium]